MKTWWRSTRSVSRLGIAGSTTGFRHQNRLRSRSTEDRHRLPHVATQDQTLSDQYHQKALSRFYGRQMATL